MFAVTYGAALTSEVVHIAGVLGVPLVVQLGSFGALQRGMNVGDLFFPTLAGRGEAASDSYLAPDEPADASADLLAWMRGQAQERGLTTHTGRHYTTAAMLGETRQDIARWNADGYCGVDLETATTFAVARHFGMRRVAALALIDNLIEDHSIMDVTTDQRAVFKHTQNLAAQLALDTIVEWGGMPNAPAMPLEQQEAHELGLRLRDETTDAT
jgi:uridine phosphorylase